RRPWGPVVRIEVERTMPPLLRELLQRELRFEESALQSALGPSDVYEADGALDVGGLGELAAGAARPDLDYPPVTPRDRFGGGGPQANPSTRVIKNRRGASPGRTSDGGAAPTLRASGERQLQPRNSVTIHGRRPVYVDPWDQRAAARAVQRADMIVAPAAGG